MVALISLHETPISPTLPGERIGCHSCKRVGPGSFDKMMAPNIKKYKPLTLEKPGRLPVESQKECLELMKIC